MNPRHCSEISVLFRISRGLPSVAKACYIRCFGQRHPLLFSADRGCIFGKKGRESAIDIRPVNDPLDAASLVGGEELK
jgi:hypothetical protein